MPDGLVHRAYLYEDPDDYVRAVSGFVLEGVESGDPVLVAVPRPQLRRLLPALRAHAHAIEFRNMEEVGRNPARIIPFVTDFLARHRGRHVRFVGEPIWHGRSESEITEGVRHEALLNVAFANAVATILCPYDAAGLAGAGALAGCTHPELTCRDATPRSHEYRDPLEVYAAHDRLLQPPSGRVTARIVSPDLRSLREWVQDQARAAALPSRRTKDLVLAANEAVSNTLVHAEGRGVARIWLGGGEIVCEIADHGRIDDPLAGRRAPGIERLGGRGLWLINHLCDLVELRSGEDGTMLRLHMALG